MNTEKGLGPATVRGMVGDAVRMVRENEVDVVVTDLFMPGQEGLETIQILPGTLQTSELSRYLEVSEGAELGFLLGRRLHGGEASLIITREVGRNAEHAFNQHELATMVHFVFLDRGEHIETRAAGG